MPHEHKIRQGEVYWLDDCPPLDGDEMKDRPVVVISTAKMLASDPLVVVVAASTTPHRDRDPDLVKLPTRQDTPRTRSGLPKTCWAVPRWILRVERARLKDPVGFISGPTLSRIVTAVDHRMGELRNAEGKGP